MPERAAILVVEDNESIRYLVQEMLELEHEVESFESAEPAVARAAERRFDLVMLDATLPGMSGTEALAALRAMPAYADTPIVAMTAYAQGTTREAYLQQGFSAFLPKPFTPDDLERVVMQALGPNG